MIFASSTSGVGGISGSPNNVLPSRGIYRSDNAAGASPTFTKMTGLAANANASVRDLAIDPNDPNILIANVIIGGGTGGIYRSTVQRCGLRRANRQVHYIFPTDRVTFSAKTREEQPAMRPTHSSTDTVIG